MPSPCDPLSIRVPELATAPLSTQLAALAEAIATVGHIGPQEAPQTALVLLHMAMQAERQEKALDAAGVAAAELHKIEGESR